MKARQFRYYDLLVHIFVVLLLISNLVGQKITAIGPVRVGGAQLLFPLTYIFGDVFTEVYGYGASRRAIWIGFLASALLCGYRRRLAGIIRMRTGRSFIRCRDWLPRVSSPTGAANSPIRSCSRK